MQQYEVEGLLFSDVTAFGEISATHDQIEHLQRIRLRFQTPEDINDSKDTAPSKRIEHLMPGYRKRVHGLLIAEKIGLEVIRNECPRFDRWLVRLESLGSA